MAKRHDATLTVDDLPVHLVQEVNLLLDKERTLMELRLMEKELESAKWKSKYDELKVAIVDSEESGAKQVEELDLVGGVESGARAGDPQHSQNVSALLLSRVRGNIADFSGVHMTKQTLSALTKALLGARSEYPQVDILILSDCGISHDSIDTIEYILRSTRIKALDISRNNLDDDVMFSFVEILNNRKHTPQYVLMHGQSTSWAQSERACTEILEALHKHTWGVSISLEDMPANAKEIMDRQIDQGKKRGEDVTDLLFKDVKSNHRVAKFLSQLQAKIRLSQMKDDLDQLQAAATASKASKRAGQKRGAEGCIGRFGKTMPRLVDHLQDLTVLGLTECALSAPALKELESTLDLTRSTLTDLDLSFSYIGVRGAMMLSKALQHPQCQLVALRLKGNFLGNPGAQNLADGLRQNHTLTYLDLRHNCISYRGVEAMSGALLATKTLSVLDLAQNDIDPADAQSLDTLLHDKSSQLFVHWGVGAARAEPWILPPNTNVYVSRLLQLEKTCRVGGRILLAELSLADLFFQYPISEHKPLVLRWKMRPAPMRSYDDNQRDMMLLRTQSHVVYNEQEIMQEPYALLNGVVSFGWELTAAHNRHHYLTETGDLSDEYPTRSTLVGDSPLSWVACAALIQQLPPEGTLRLYAQVGLLRPEARFHPSRAYMKVQWKDLVAYSLETPQGWHYLGGDHIHKQDQQQQEETYITSLQRNLQHDYRHYLQEAALRGGGFRILRGFGWFYRTRIAKIVFEARLTAAHPAHTDSGSSSSASSGVPQLLPRMTRERFVDFEWLVACRPADGTAQIVAQQSCLQILRSRHTDMQSSEEEVFLPWQWQRFEVEVRQLVTQDTLVLMARPTFRSDASSTIAGVGGAKAEAVDAGVVKKLLAQCTVTARNVQLFTYLGEHESQHHADAKDDDDIDIDAGGGNNSNKGVLHDIDNETFNSLAPVFSDPHEVYEGFHSWTDYQDSEQRQQTQDAWRLRLQSQGVEDLDTLHHEHVRSVLQTPPPHGNEALYAELLPWVEAADAAV